MNLGEKIALSKERWERVAFDYYSTPPEVTHALLTWLRLGPCTVREPCCGDGAMSEVLKARGHTVISSDIRHTGYGEGGVDYTLRGSNETFDAVISNPPFASAEAIIRRALREAPIVAVLLSNNYWHAQSRAALWKLLPPMAVLALTWRVNFLPERGSGALANMIWTVWSRGWTGPCQYHMLKRGAPEATSALRLERCSNFIRLRAALARRSAV